MRGGVYRSWASCRQRVRTVCGLYDVTCPDCDQNADAWCLTPGRPHSSRSRRARELTEQQEPRF
ncbi:hypothetical protein [Streptomyces gardneri]|uniref:hypothetical protein n=1 Tax=Streptomyces gardneri TaxID=66892 RepID=UPI003F4CE81E